MPQIGRIYIYDTMGEKKIDITDYFKTGLFYFYTAEDDPTYQYLIRKTSPQFMEKSMLLMLMKSDKRFSVGNNDKEKYLIQNIVHDTPDFSQNMKYDCSYVSDTGNNLEEMYEGYYTYQGQEYTITIQIDYPSSEQLQKVNGYSYFSITLKKGYRPPTISHTQMKADAQKQAQPVTF